MSGEIVSAPRVHREHRNPSLLPREHGVYAEVGFPVLTALTLGDVSAHGACLAAVVIAAFLLHEPFLVLLGRRGARVRADLGRSVRIYAAILAALVVVCSVAGLWHAATEVRIAFVLLVPVAIPITLLIVTRQEKTFLGESLIAVVLAFAAVPIALACGVSATAALTAAGVWTAAFLMSTATVHAILVRAKRRAAGPAVIVASAALVLVGGAVIAIATGGPRWTLALAPVPIVCAGVLAAGLPAKRLRTLGWLLVLANLATTVLLLVALTSRSSS